MEREMQNDWAELVEEILALAVLSRQVVLDSADGWGPDCGVVPVMIVEVQPAW